MTPDPDCIPWPPPPTYHNPFWETTKSGICFRIHYWILYFHIYLLYPFPLRTPSAGTNQQIRICLFPLLPASRFSYSPNKYLHPNVIHFDCRHCPCSEIVYGNWTECICLFTNDQVRAYRKSNFRIYTIQPFAAKNARFSFKSTCLKKRCSLNKNAHMCPPHTLNPYWKFLYKEHDQPFWMTIPIETLLQYSKSSKCFHSVVQYLNTCNYLGTLLHYSKTCNYLGTMLQYSNTCNNFGTVLQYSNTWRCVYNKNDMWHVLRHVLCRTKGY